MEIKIRYKGKDIVLNEADIIVLYTLAKLGEASEVKLKAIYFLYKKVTENG